LVSALARQALPLMSPAMPSASLPKIPQMTDERRERRSEN
jgi:hypothetical protein